MSANQYLVDVMTRHGVLVERYSTGEWKKVEPVLDKMARDLQSAIATASLTADQLRQAEISLNEITKVVEAYTTQMTNKLSTDLPNFAGFEVEFNQQVIGNAVTVKLAGVSLETVSAIAKNSGLVLVSGQDVTYTTFDDMVRTFTNTAAKDVATTIRAGVVEGRTTTQIAKDVADLVKTRTKQQAEALTRTAIASISAQASKEVVAQNSYLFKGEKWLATLDSRTTLICAGRDGTIYPVGKGPYPPAHYRCRSRRIPVIKREYMVTDIGGTRASKYGQVSANTTYGGWLKRQPEEFQIEVLGKERAELFRSGKVDIKGFTDPMGRTYTLDELKAKNGITL